MPKADEKMVHRVAKVLALQRGHKDVNAPIQTINAGERPVWEFYRTDARIVLEHAFNEDATIPNGDQRHG
jgi:hypothetical protein